MNLLPKISPRDAGQRQALLQRKLMRREAEIGGKLFGPVPKGHNRQFFCLDERTWVWHEEWVDRSGQKKAATTRYELTQTGLLKVQDGGVYQRLSRDEAKNLYNALHLYKQKVTAYYQNLLQTA